MKKTKTEIRLLKAKFDEKILGIDIREDIGFRLEQRMKEFGWSNRGLETVCGVDEKTIRLIKKYDHNVSVDILVRLCLAMEVPISDFLKDIDKIEEYID
jgi:DNA-binding Xre family transcriptional regulator